MYMIRVKGYDYWWGSSKSGVFLPNNRRDSTTTPASPAVMKSEKEGIKCNQQALS